MGLGWWLCGLNNAKSLQEILGRLTLAHALGPAPLSLSLSDSVHRLFHHLHPFNRACLPPSLLLHLLFLFLVLPLLFICCPAESPATQPCKSPADRLPQNTSLSVPQGSWTTPNSTRPQPDRPHAHLSCSSTTGTRLLATTRSILARKSISVLYSVTLTSHGRSYTVGLYVSHHPPLPKCPPGRLLI